MAAPEHVPVVGTRPVRSYSSPPRRAGSWTADRPGELVGRQPAGEHLGTPGPDQGYALTLVEQFRDRLVLGRAPVVHDVTVALTVWGCLDAGADPELVSVRREWFEEVHHVHHYPELRRIVDAVPASVLVLPHTVVEAQYARDWRSCVDLGA